MKTNMIKTATLILAVVITTSLDAQNTKSFKENRLTEKIGKILKENAANLSHEITNLKELVQYKPSGNFEFTAEKTSEIVQIDLSSLESIVKYKPGSYNESVLNADADDNFTQVLDELKKVVKYQPATAAPVSDEWENVKNELAAMVRYYPQS